MRHAKIFFPLLKEKASIYQTKLYYFDTDKFRENENFNKILNKYHVSSVPMVVKLSNGFYFILFVSIFYCVFT